MREVAGLAVLTLRDLPEGAVEAAATFYREHLEMARRAATTADLAIVLDPVPHDHSDWRRALARDLARKNAPRRVNVIAGGEGGELEEVLAFLAEAPGVTGQYLELGGQD